MQICFRIIVNFPIYDFKGSLYLSQYFGTYKLVILKLHCTFHPRVPDVTTNIVNSEWGGCLKSALKSPHPGLSHKTGFGDFQLPAREADCQIYLSTFSSKYLCHC